MSEPIDLLDPRALERGAEEGTLDRALAAWAPRLDGPPRDDPKDEARRAILRAIRRDLPSIVRDPSLLFTCLYRRVFWHGSPEERAFYELDALEPSSSAAASGPLLRAWLEQWRRDRIARGVAAPWARSLRPLEHPLDAPVLEEYREDLAEGGALRFSEDGRAIGTIQAHRRGKGSVAWDRQTGQRLGATEIRRLFVDAKASTLELERAEGGHCRVRDRASGERIVDLELDVWRLDLLAALPGGGILVAGWKEDYIGVVFRLDPPYQATQWCAEVGGYLQGLAVWASGRVLTVSDSRTVYLLDAGSGERLARVPADTRGIAVDASGALLATLEVDLIRVWDIGALRSGRRASLEGSEAGWVDAQFSPDGRRLLTGGLLCDAQDGRLVARLHLDGPGYLEGGPPETGRQLANGRFVEMAPLRGVCVWETEGGQRMVKDESRRYGSSDSIVISPDGLHYTRGQQRFGEEAPEGELELRRTDDGDLCAHLALARYVCVRFSPTGARVAVGAGGGEVVVFSVPEGRPVLRIAVCRAAITDVVFSRDERLLLTAARDGVLRLWEATSGRLAGERAPGSDPIVSGWTAAERDRDGWTLRPEALACVEGWLGFSTCAHPFIGKRRRGLFEIIERTRGDAIVRVPTHHTLVADPSGARWAFRSAHFAVEQE